MGNTATDCTATPSALQQPEWCDTAQVQRIRDFLAARPPLVRISDVRALRSLLAQVATGEALVVQAGDCAEDPEECTGQHVRRKSAVLDLLAGTLKIDTGLPVLRAGRIAGQFAKPRSRSTEQVGDLVLPVYRGHMVNGPEPTAEDRRPDPLRILTCYMAAGDVMEHLGWRDPAVRSSLEPVVWTSHEALLLDYEMPMVRELADGSRWLSSTHWPWIGERSRQIDGAHVAMLAEVVNPVACKIGPSSTVDEVLALCERLDPLREPGRLTLIARMGADLVADRLPALVEAVRQAGHPVIWSCDPLHANTITAPNGRKTRLVDSVGREVRGFREAVAAGGGVAGGLHLETTPDEVSECVADASELDRAGETYTSLCDPRLTPAQAVQVVSAWSARAADAPAPAEKTPGTAGIPPIRAYSLPEAESLPANIATWELDPARAVLLLHDMQTYFLKPLPEPTRTELVHNASLLRKRCADLGVQVAYTAQPGRMTPDQRGLLKDFWGEGMRATGEDREVVAELTPAPDDWVFTKWRYSALFKSELLERMRASGRDQLVIAGVYGHIGIMTTALDAYSHDIEVFLVADAIGDFSEELHRLTLDHVARSCGKVVTLGGVFA